MALSGATFRTYVFFSFVLGSLVVGHAAFQKRFFYRTMVYLGESKLAIMAAANIALVTVVIVWKTVQRIFLGPLRFREVERLNTRARDAIIECCFATTIFRDEVNLLFLALVTMLLMLKSLHWLAKDRMDFLEEQPLSPRSAHVRLVGLMSLLFTVDMYLVYRCAKTTLRSKGGTMLVLFAFEFTVLLIELCSDYVRYLFHAIDLRLDGRWDARGLYSFYNELVTDLCQLTVYLAFFLYVHTFYTFPLHILREVYITFTKFQRRCHDFIRYRRVVSTMNELFADATEEELAAGDRTCIICREEMQTAKKLACGHMFHARCLQSWLKRQLTCPTCRLNVDVNTPLRPENAPAPDGVARDPAQAPVGAPVPPPPDDVPQGPGFWDNAWRLWRHIAYGEPRNGVPAPQPGQLGAGAAAAGGAGAGAGGDARPRQMQRRAFWPNVRFGIRIGRAQRGGPGLGGRPQEMEFAPFPPGMPIPGDHPLQQRLRQIMAAHGVPPNLPPQAIPGNLPPQHMPFTRPLHNNGAPAAQLNPHAPPIDQLIVIQENLAVIRRQLDTLRDHVQTLLVQATEQAAARQGAADAPPPVPQTAAAPAGNAQDAQAAAPQRRDDAANGM